MLTPFNWTAFEDNYRTVIAPLGEQTIRMKFRCVNEECMCWIYPMEIDVPEPNMMAENHRESEVEVNSAVNCPECDEYHEISLSNGFGGAQIHINGLDNTEIYFREVDEELESILLTTNYYQIFEHNVDRLIQYIDDLDQEDPYLNNLFLLSGIASMESYLTIALINLVEQDESKYKVALKKISRFDYSKHIDDIFNNDLDELKSNILKEISKISFHNINNIKKYFGGILSIEIEYDFSTLGQVIQYRHDIVHRNGRTIDGDELNINREQLVEYLREINDFVEYINQQLTTD